MQDIVARATPMWERLGGVPLLGDRTDSEEVLEARLKKWREVMGGAQALERRLAPNGLPGAPNAPAHAPDAQGLPDWALTLRSALARTGEALPSRGESAPAPSGSRAFPFEPAFRPCAAVAREQLEIQAGPALAVMGPAARIALERQLIAHLSFIASLVLLEDFSLYRFRHAPAAAFEELWSRLAPSTGLYEAYVTDLLEGGWSRLLTLRPVLGRLLGQAVNQWVAATARLCHRFADDSALLARTFDWAIGSSTGAVEWVRTDLSDRHNGGQTVVELGLTGGGRVIYKPRTVRAEAVFNEFIARIGAPAASPGLRVIKVVERAGYGWCEVATPVPCSSAEGLERFYARTGMLLAVLHLLSATDIHCENIIAAGEHPVIVDLETMLASGPLVADAGSSVMSTGLLPRWQTAPDGRRFDLSGLSADGTQDAGIGRRAWLHLNTDQMGLSGRQDFRASMTHLPAPTDASSAGRYLAPLVEGFKQMYLHLLRLRPAILAGQTALDMFDGIELRTLIRGTATYTRLQLRLLHPELMASGLDRSIELEWLARPLSGPLPHKRNRQAVYEHELAAMEALDVPYFTTSFAARLSETEGEDDLDFVRARRNQALVRARLEELSADDCERQVAIIRQAMSDRYSLVD